MGLQTERAPPSRLAALGTRPLVADNLAGLECHAAAVAALLERPAHGPRVLDHRVDLGDLRVDERSPAPLLARAARSSKQRAELVEAEADPLAEADQDRRSTVSGP